MKTAFRAFALIACAAAISIAPASLNAQQEQQRQRPQPTEPVAPAPAPAAKPPAAKPPAAKPPAAAQSSEAPTAPQGEPTLPPPSPPPPIPSPAGTPLPAPSIGVIDIQFLIAETSAGRSIRIQMEKQRINVGRELQQRETQLRNSEQELLRQRGQLSPDQQNEKIRALEQRRQDLRRTIEQRQRQLEQNFASAVRQLEKAIEDELKLVAAERGLNMILPRHAVPLLSPDFDLTGELYQRVEKRLPDVKVQAAPVTSGNN